MTQGQQRHNIAGEIKTSEQVCSRCCPIRTTAPASPADNAMAGVVRPLAGGYVAIFRESPRQRLKRLQRLCAIYIQHGSKVFNAAVREEAEKLERRTDIVFVLASARVKAHLRRKILLAKAGLTLIGTGDIGISRKGKYDDSDDFVRVFEFVFETAERAPPSENSLRLCQISLLTPSSVWLGFVSPRALRAPTRAARCERVAWVM